MDEELNNLQTTETAQVPNTPYSGVLSLAQLQQMAQPNDSRVFSLEELKQKRATQEIEENKFSPLISAGLGFANASSFGLVSQIAEKTGLVEQETLSALKEVNPISYTAGELSSFIIPGTGLAKGGGLVAKGLRAAGTPIQQVAKAGQFVNAATQAKLAGVIGSSKSADIVSKIIGSGLGSAVEGAAYGAQQFISDEAMGDPSANAENFLSRIGTSTALAGGVGAGFSALGQGFKLAASNYKEGARGVFKTVSGLDDEVIDQVASEKGYERIRTLMKEPGEHSDKIKNFALDQFEDLNVKYKNYFKNFDEASELAVKELDQTMQPVALKDLIKESDDILKSIKKGEFTPAEDVRVIEKITREVEGFKNQMTRAAFNNAEEAGLAGLLKQDLKKFRGTKKQKEEILGRFFKDKTLQSELYLKPSQLNAIRIEMNKVAQRRNVYDPLKETKSGGDEFAALGNKVREILYGKAPEKSAFKKLNADYGKQAAAFKELKRFAIKDKDFKKFGSEEKIAQLLSGTTKRAQTARKYLQDLDDVLETDLVGTQKFLNAYDKVTQSKLAPILTGYSQMVPALGAMFGLSLGLSPAAAGAFYLAGAAAQAPILRAPLIRGATQLSKVIDEGVALKTAAGKSVPPGMVPFLAAKIAAMGQIERDVKSAAKPFEEVNEIVIERKPVPFKELREFKKTPEEIYKLDSDPQYFQEKFEKSIEELKFAYPSMIEPLRQQLQQRVSYLASVFPKDQVSEYLFDQPAPINDLDRQRFVERANVVEDPRHILKALSENRLTQEMVNVFRTFYPSNYRSAVSKILEASPEQIKKMDYTQKQQLSILLGQPLTSALTPERFMALQRNFAPQNKDVQQASNNDLRGMQEIVQNTYSAGQKTQER